ncbi:MAG: chromosome segregation protein SMC [Oscillospiraceae bacterium]|jgi:chromosome segregation protein|nr:chromosome segregation protein SMC [Oscillospiraceae bacterium]
MRLTALEIHGFKSFPDKTRLEFGPGITCVVGPNGSGKSNVSDAVRWVLGEQSTRQLRGAKMEDVIFSGTGTRRSQGLAEVTLHLDNYDFKLNNCDEKDVSVTRRLYRSGESDYLINGKSVRLKDVHELFMDTGLGRDGYSLVGQGRVADLMSSRSEQRRDMLEEAAGISQSRYRRAAAIHKLNQAEENLLRLRDILLELEGRVEPLRLQKEKAEKFLALAQTRKRLEIGLGLHTIQQSTAALREQEHKITRAKAEYDAAGAQLEEVEAALEELTQKAQTLTLQMEELRRGAAAQEEQAVRQEGEAAVLENTIAHNRLALERLERDRSHATDTQQQLSAEIDAALEEITALRQEMAARRTGLLDCAKQDEQAKAQQAELEGQAAALARETAERTEQLAQRQIAQSAADSGIAELNSRMESIRRSQAGRQEQTAQLEAQREQAARALEESRAAVDELQNKLRGYELRQHNRSEKAAQAQRALEETRGALQQTQSRMKLLEDLEQNMEGYSGSVKAVMRETRRGTLTGLHGTLSQLIHVEPDYTLAVETALGAALQFVVAETEQDAKRAIALLQRSNAGRATFLPLSSVRGQQFRESGLERCRGFIAMADTLVAHDPKYQQLISAQLARTAVAESLDDAIALAKQYQNRFRVVTLDGQVIHAGGSMTGGSRAQGAGILSRANEIEKLKRAQREMEGQLSEQAAQTKRLAEAAAAAQAEVLGLQGDIARALETVIRQESQVNATLARMQDAQVAGAELQAELISSARRLEQLEQARHMGDEEAKLLEEQRAQLLAKQNEIQRQSAELAQRRAAIGQTEAALRLDLLSTEKDVESREELAASLRQRSLSHAGRGQALLEEQSQLQSSNERTAAQIEQLNAGITQLREQAARARQALAALEQEREELQGRAETQRQEERMLLGQREKRGGELARQEERRAQAQQALDTAANKLYDEYQLSPRQAELQGFTLDDPAQALIDLNDVSAKIRSLGNINVDAIDEYREVAERYAFLKLQIDDVEQSREELTKLIAELTQKMSERFREQFHKINRYFGETFQELFSGGQAALELDNPLDMLESAIEIRVQPPGKNVQNIDLLSGGEKGLSAIALLFAILKTTPSPFCIFDEVEAALDDVNVTRYARYVRRMTKNTQFILITHRRGTMEEADMLYGVTMQEEGVSKLLEMNTKEIVGKLGI